MPQLDFLSYFSQFFYFYMLFVVFYFFLLLTVLPALVRNLKFRSKAISRLEALNLRYTLRLNHVFRFRSFSLVFKKLNGFASKSLNKFSLFFLFVNFYVLSSKQLSGLNNLLQDSFSELSSKRETFTRK